MPSLLSAEAKLAISGKYEKTNVDFFSRLDEGAIRAMDNDGISRCAAERKKKKLRKYDDDINDNNNEIK